MELLAIWCLFCVAAGGAANARGRSGIGWFMLALVISPLIAIVFVVLMRDLSRERPLTANTRPEPTYLNPTRRVPIDAPPKARWGGKADRVSIDRRPKPFEPDGVYAGYPYRVTDSGAVEAIMHGTVVRFATLEKFTAAIGPA